MVKYRFNKVVRKACLGLILVSMMLGGCGSSASKEASYSAPAYKGDYYSDDVYEMAEEAAYYDEDMTAAAGGASNGMETTQAETVSDNRKLIKTVNIDAETEEFDTFISNIDARITALGGYAESKNIGGRSFNDVRSNRYAYIVARIPSSRLSEFVSTIETVSNITNKSESVDDVTLQYVDMEAHVDSLRTEQSRLDELIREAEDLDTILALEARLTEVRYQLESYESQLRTMQNKVDYSTVYLNVNEVQRISPQPEYEKTAWERMATGFVDSTIDVLNGLEEFFILFVTGIPYIIVFVLFIGIFVGIILLIVKLCIKRAGTKQARLQKKYEKRMQKQQMKAQKHPSQSSQNTQLQTSDTTENKPDSTEQK